MLRPQDLYQRVQSSSLLIFLILGRKDGTWLGLGSDEEGEDEEEEDEGGEDGRFAIRAAGESEMTGTEERTTECAAEDDGTAGA